MAGFSYACKWTSVCYSWMQQGVSMISVELDPDIKQTMMEDILEPIQQLEIPTNELVIVGGAVLQIHGLKYTPDIDVVVPPTRLEKIIDEWEAIPWENDRQRAGELGRLGIGLLITRHNIGQI